MVLELDWQVHKTTEIAIIAIGNGASIVADGIRKQCDNCVMQITSTRWRNWSNAPYIRWKVPRKGACRFESCPGRKWFFSVNINNYSDDWKWLRNDAQALWLSIWTCQRIRVGGCILCWLEGVVWYCRNRIDKSREFFGRLFRTRQWSVSVFFNRPRVRPNNACKSISWVSKLELW